VKRNLFVLFVLSIFIVAPSFAATKFKDVPDSHWASSSVYDMVRMGITKGYPDGTFRGDKSISRYETAVFLSKLSKSISIESVNADLASLKSDVLALKKQKEASVFYGNYEGDWKIANLVSSIGGYKATVSSYRLISGVKQKINENTDVDINLDTEDYGYYNDGTVSLESLAANLLVIDSKIKLNLADLGFNNPVTLQLTYGPGPKKRSLDPTHAIPSDIGYVYWRPHTGIKAYTNLWGFDISGGYIALDNNTTGKINTSQFTGTINYKIGNVPWLNEIKLDATGDYVFTGMYNRPDCRNTRASLTLAAPLGSKIDAEGKIAGGGSTQSSLMVAGKLDLKDVWDTGTVATLQFSKIGATFIDPNFTAQEFYFTGVDPFNRVLETGTVNLGGKVAQMLDPNFTLVGKGEITLNSNYQYDTTKGKLTAEGGISYAIAPNTSLDAMYRIYQDKSVSDTSDLASLGLNYNF